MHSVLSLSDRLSQKAFTVNWQLGNLVTLSLYNTTFERWFGDIKPGERFY
jgi:hypothetical protein